MCSAWVLPFTDMSPDGDQEYLSDGIAEELLTLLAQIPDLQVASVDELFEWLELAYVQRDGSLPDMLSDPFLRQFSDDPRFVDVLKKGGLYEAWLKTRT